MRTAFMKALRNADRKLRHRRNDHLLKKIFGEAERQKIKEATAEAEKQTSGEIKVSIAHRFDRGVSDVFTQARREFFRLKMHETRDKTGVLLLLVWNECRFQILADEGILKKLPQAYWDNLAIRLASNFKEDLFVGPICEVVKEIGRVLSEYFPRQDDDANELSDDISVGDE